MTAWHQFSAKVETSDVVHQLACDPARPVLRWCGPSPYPSFFERLPIWSCACVLCFSSGNSRSKDGRTGRDRRKNPIGACFIYIFFCVFFGGAKHRRATHSLKKIKVSQFVTVVSDRRYRWQKHERSERYTYCNAACFSPRNRKAFSVRCTDVPGLYRKDSSKTFAVEAPHRLLIICLRSLSGLRQAFSLRQAAVDRPRLRRYFDTTRRDTKMPS